MPPRSPQHAALGRAVRERRRELGLSQQGLGSAVGMDRSYVSDVERGVRNPRFTNVVRLAIALELPPAVLCARTEALYGIDGDQHERRRTAST
jgi:transcriptional regulator with XRE-family HTH domain